MRASAISANARMVAIAAIMNAGTMVIRRSVRPPPSTLAPLRKSSIGAMGHLVTSPARNIGIGYSCQPPVPSVPMDTKKPNRVHDIEPASAVVTQTGDKPEYATHAGFLAGDVGAIACRPAYRWREAVHQR